MREPNSIFCSYLNLIEFSGTELGDNIIEAIRTAQTEAYNEALEDAVVHVQLKESTDIEEYNEMPSMSNDMGDVWVIDKQSILKLKKV